MQLGEGSLKKSAIFILLVSYTRIVPVREKKNSSEKLGQLVSEKNHMTDFVAYFGKITNL